MKRVVCCDVCGRKFFAKREDAKYCSKRCKYARWYHGSEYVAPQVEESAARMRRREYFRQRDEEFERAGGVRVRVVVNEDGTKRITRGHGFGSNA